MPDPSLQAYLASKYLSGPKADAILARHGSDGDTLKKKRKKRRTDEAGSSSSASFKLKDDDDESWKRLGGGGGGRDDEEGDAQVVQSSSNDGSFKKARMMALDKDGNRVIVGEEVELGEDAPQMATEGGRGMDEEERERLQGELERQARRAADAEAEGEGDGEGSTTTLQQQQEQPKKKIKAGLKTKEEVRAERLAREEAKRREVESGSSVVRGNEGRGGSTTAAAQASGQEAETVYRDASGRRIDVAAEEEELRLQARQAEAKERERKEWTKGQVQRDEAERRRKELKEMEKEKVSRHATDKSYNDRLKQLDERSDDPALAFLTKKREKGPQKPKYKGPPPPPNRFGIQPGYRWDGVDRGNGFERMLFQKRNERSRREAIGHAMDMEDL